MIKVVRYLDGLALDREPMPSASAN